MKRAGFTMIELVFVIVILGILATVAVPRILATREDAKISTEVANLATCIQDLGSKYIADGNITDVNASSSACKQIRCFTLTATADGNLTIKNISGGAYCAQVHVLAGSKDLNGTHSFGGSHIVY
ncbi:MAG TPA: type II secretion system protein [Sulfurimonas autotrophica]|nr:type II secretion system protein [Sulfurimonas autotrophica]